MRGSRVAASTQRFVPTNQIRQLMTIRIDPDVLDAARDRATDENRTLTNYIETVLRRDLGLMGMVGARRKTPAKPRM